MRNFLNKVAIADDLDEVTAIDEPGEADPGEAGLSKAKTSAIWRAVQRLYRTGYYPAIMFCMRRRGKIVLNRAIGHVSGNGPRDAADAPKVLATPNTPSCLFSASKALSAMVLHRLDEMGEIHLLNPISYYIPEFAKHGKERITIYQLLSHRAGIPGVPGAEGHQVVFDHARSVELLCDLRPEHTLGRRQAYHAVTGGFIMDELVRRVTGKDMRWAWRTWFKKPMEFSVLDYGATAAVRKRMTVEELTGINDLPLLDALTRRAIGVTLREVIEFLDDDAFYRSIIPSANMVSTAEELSGFYQMLLDGGKWQGRTIVQSDTVMRATAEAGPPVFDGSLGIPLRFSPGFMLGGHRFSFYGHQSDNAYGHIGLANNFAWADPDRHLSVAMLVSGIPLLAGNVRALMGAINTIASNCLVLE